MKQMIANAIAFATAKHDGQFDRGGLPYVLHPLKVMHYLKTDDEELMCIAVLHDVIEDCYPVMDRHVGYSDLREIGMSERVVAGVKALSKIPGVDYWTYIEDIIRHNPDARKVKMADLRHNMDIRRLKGVSPKDISRLERYARAYQYLKTVEESH